MAGGDPKTLPPLIPEDEFDDTPEELVGQLNEQEESEPDLQQVWDEIRQRRSTESPTKTDPIEATKRQELHQKELERSQKIADKVKTGKQVAQKTVTKGSEQAATNAVKEQAVKAGERSARAAARAAGEATKKAAKQAGKAIGQAIKKLVTQLLAKNPYVWLAVGIILLVIIIVLIIVALFSFSGDTGKGPARYPSTREEKYAAVTSLAMANDPRAKQEVVVTEAKNLQEKLKNIKKNAETKYGVGSAKAAEAIKAVDAIIAQLDEVIAKSSSPTERGKIIEDLNSKTKALQETYQELFFTAGTCADLKPYLDSGQFKVLEGPNGKLILKGQMMNAARQIWPASQDLCKALLIGLQGGYSITTRNLSYTHSKLTASGNISRHWCGAAIDIGRVNNEAVTGSSQATLGLAKLLFEAGNQGSVHIGELILPNNYNQYEMKNGKKNIFNYDIKARDHEDHIHLSGRVVDTRCGR